MSRGPEACRARTAHNAGERKIATPCNQASVGRRACGQELSASYDPQICREGWIDVPCSASNSKPTSSTIISTCHSRVSSQDLSLFPMQHRGSLYYYRPFQEPFPPF